MDPYAHTLIATAMLFIAYVVGKKLGRTEGISLSVNYLIQMGACTEDDLKKANDRFIAEQEDDY